MNTTIPPSGLSSPPTFDAALLGQFVQSNAAGKSERIDNLDVSKFFDEVMKIASQFRQAAPTNLSDPLTDANGAPRIDTPHEEFSVEEMTDLLRSLRGKSQDQQLKAAHEGIEAARIKAEKNNNAQLEKIKEWIEACEEAANKGILGKVFGWIGKIVAALAAVAMLAIAVVATIATSGAAAPLLAVALVGVAASTMSLMSAISEEAGGPEISIGSLIRETLGRALQAMGVDEETANNISNVVGGVAAIACLGLPFLVEPQLMGNMVSGVALLAGADEQTAGYLAMATTIVTAVIVGIALVVVTAGTSVASAGTSAATQVGNASVSGATTAASAATTGASAATTGAAAATTAGTAAVSTAAQTGAQAGARVVAETMKTLNTMIMGTSAVITGTTQITTGALAIDKAKTEEEAEQAIAAKKELAAVMIKLQKQMEEGREELKKILQQMEDATQLVSQMIAGTADSMSQITKNMSGKSTV